MIGAVGSIGRLMSTSALTRFVGALDGLQALRAYSVRKLYSNYTGACVRVRRTSDGAETDIGFKLYAFRTYAYWIDEEALLAFAGSSSLTIVYWYDQSGNNGHAEQTNAFSQPRIVNAGVLDTDLGLPVIVFEGSARSLNLNININRTTYPNLSISVVYRCDTLSSSQCLWGADNGNWDRLQLLNFDAVPVLSFGITNGSTAIPQNLLNNTNKNVYMAIMSLNAANGSNVFVNGVAGTSFTEIIGDGHINLSIGNISAFGNFGLRGNMSEFVVFGNVLSTTTRQAIERGQGAAFGITVA